ncbi:Acidic repeat-containing protein [Camponotus floridanus]|uniref:Acidic repeat-containing protein n=1 Tax=Camponotus floridanus TaxID=104421 RepID=E2AWB5_CAMFO|nr:Acidic repeat-containing protein [Camponotus floridanus]
MTSDYMTDSVSDSQNFTLRLSEDSIIEDTQDLVATSKTKDKDDIIIISDSSCSSSPERNSKSRWKYNSNSIKNKKEKYPRLYFLETSSSESEYEKPNLSCKWIARSDDKPLERKYINKTTIQINKASYTSDETANSGSINDRNTKNKINNDKSYKNPILMFPEKKMIDSKMREKYNVKKANEVITPNYLTYSDGSDITNRVNKFPVYNTLQRDKTGKMKLTKQDTHKILKNIKSTQVVYNSPREKKETNVIIDESTDEHVIHPAISPNYDKKIKYNFNDDPDVIDTSLKDNVSSQTDLLKSYKTYSKFLDVLRKEDLHKSLSERKKRQIAEWLMTNSPNSLSDSSCSNIPLSIRNSIDSGNSSLERLELDYETPNNRGKINKVQTEKQTTIINSDKVINSFLTHQTITDEYFKNPNNNISQFNTPDRSLLKVNTDKKVASSVINTPTNMDIMNCADILDNLYGNTWRDKANALLPTTEPRKTSNQITNRIIQTERKPISKNRYYITDSDSDSNKSDMVKNIKLNRKKNIQQNQRKEDSFINDESLSSDSESLYHTALTNPRTSINSTASKPMPVVSSIKRLQAICDIDTEDENDKSSSSKEKSEVPKKNLHRRRLSFSDDESSSTSEFDPGDYVPPKYIYKKEVNRTPQQSRFKLVAANKSIGYKSFLTSLSSTIPISNTHPDAQKYRLDYKNNKDELCKKLYKLYNEKVFDNQLPQDMSIEWNIRMRGTAGFCYNKKSIRTLSGVVKSSRIVLATKIVDTPDRLRDTLIHEMCHAATWLINDISDGHGPFWTKWANKAMETFPELPPIRRCHDYDIKTKYTYRCTGCGYSIGRHSKSLDIERKRCGHCLGKFELLVNKTTKSGIKQVQTPKREPSGFALYVKQNYNSVKKEKNNMKHAEVMKILGQQFSAIKIAKKDNVSSN